MKSINRLQNQINTLAFQESSAFDEARKIAEATTLTSLAFHDLEIMRSTTQIAESFKLASHAFKESDEMKSILKLTDSSELSSLMLQESEAMISFREIAKNYQSSTLYLQNYEAMKSLRRAANSSQFAAIALQQSEVEKQFAQLNELSSFNILKTLKNSPFNEFTNRNLFEHESLVEIDEFLVEINNEICGEVESVTDFNALSDKTKNILLYLYHCYFLPVLLSCFTTYVMTNALEAKKELSGVTTFAEAKSFVKRANAKFDRMLLKGFRVTTSKKLNFRESASMKSNVITTLPIGTLVEIIDKSNRSWLLVEVEIEGELKQGWISRKHTAYFK